MARSQVVLDTNVLDYLIANVGRDVDTAVDAFADSYVGAVQQVAPRQTGTMAGTTRKLPPVQVGVREVAVGGADSAAPYAWHVYWGTGRQPPRPFLLWALAQLTGEWSAVLTAAMLEAFSRAGGRR